MREEETVLSLTGGTFSDDLAEDLFLRTTLLLLEGWRTIVVEVVDVWWCGWAGEKRRAAGCWDSMGETDGPYIQTLTSQAADMRASLWTYIIWVLVRGPTHTHSHTALSTSRHFPHSVAHCESML